MYLPKRLRDQSLAIHQLDTVFRSLIVNGIRYAIPSLGGFITAELRGAINAEEYPYFIDFSFVFLIISGGTTPVPRNYADTAGPGVIL